MKDSVLVIIVTYNGMRWIAKCLQSLEAGTVQSNIIVIDNASTDGTADFVRFEFPKVILIESHRNLGFGGANNIGLQAALKENADFVFLLNQDAWVDRYCLEKLIAVSRKHPDYAILSPFHQDYEGIAPERYFKEFVLEQYTPDYRLDRKPTEQQEVLPTSFVHAACWLLPIATVKAVGGFDPIFFHYGEDNDYVQRTRSRGLRVGIVPGTTVYHYGTNDGLKDPKANLRLLVNQIKLRIKSPEASHIGAAFLFWKQFAQATINEGRTSSLDAYQQCAKDFMKIFRSRFQQNRPEAYLS